MFSPRVSGVLRKSAQARSNVCRGPQVRRMAGSHYLKISKTHTMWGEAFGTVCWLWIFHRARHDLPVVLGFRHPWEHAEDPFSPHTHHHGEQPKPESRSDAWDKFTSKAMIQKEVDDDEDEEDE
ncbi:predicted protein [Phaeodactylum tricornutum CCAP 1055/1]|uniref:Uncharacterized protein n=2 Tax=Phaeodactylum tricornutum TaxID=2850 RepID=B7FUA5_PHATC|nr:predicted protein [Phaeodactylum tricornutum CCAP 1055/1]EEC50226.1 predicted protein [Phaeodactylum tricornutum CCAP 1055/1]|eukprot:XP_002178561.1 predicted protein [Phaeodactylum tricornutum CCAP 1055/1]